MNFLHTVDILTIVSPDVKKGANSQFGMFKYFHILGFGHLYELTNILVNLKIPNRKFGRCLMGYRPGPNPPPPSPCTLN